LAVARAEAGFLSTRINAMEEAKQGRLGYQKPVTLENIANVLVLL
jgi:hypothetical protein